MTSQPGMLEMGLPSRDEVADRYAARTGMGLDALRWWVGFAYWKTAVVVTQLHTRYLRGESRDPRMVAIGALAPRPAWKAAASLSSAGH